MSNTVKKLNRELCNCTNLTSINIENIQEIHDGSFYNCQKLENVIFNHKLKKIPNNCFQYCHSISSINMENINIEIIEQSSFDNCKNLTNLKLGNKTNINELELPLSTIEIEPYAFANNNNLKTIVIYNSSIKIGSKAFANYPNLNNVII